MSNIADIPVMLDMTSVTKAFERMLELYSSAVAENHFMDEASDPPMVFKVGGSTNWGISVRIPGVSGSFLLTLVPQGINPRMCKPVLIDPNQK